MTAPKLVLRRKWRVRLLGLFACLLVCVVAAVYFIYVLPFWGVPFNGSRHGRVPLTPPWALECWLWEDDVNTAAFARELLEGYARHDIPVRTLLIDSPWSHRYNDFKVDEERYPAHSKFFGDLQAQGYRVVLWMTCLVNSFSKDTRVKESPEFYAEARDKGYLAGSGDLKWWKGRGGFIDYSNPDAMEWWHGMQRQVLDWGIDGWKLDGADTLLHSRWAGVPVPFARTCAGLMTTRQYMDRYARQEYRHGLSRNPEFAVLIRSMDGAWSHPEGFAPLDAAPVTWVGDNRHTWSAADRGLERAIADILASARLGYCVIGSDVAGYHGRGNPDDISQGTAALISGWKSPGPPAEQSEFGPAGEGDPIPPNVYIRWAQFSAFCGLFLNGGHGERRLWKRTAAELEIVRKFAWLHTELVPYMYSHVVECHRGGRPLMRPLKTGDFHYRFGDDFLVAPIHRDDLSRTVTLPEGTWWYLFDDDEPIHGPVQLTRDFPLDEYPVFVRDGAVVPLNVSRPYTGLGDRDSAGFRTWLIYPNGSAEFTLHHPETHPEPETTSVRVDARAGLLRIRFSGKQEPHILRIRTDKKPATVTRDAEPLVEGAEWTFDPAAGRVVIPTRSYTGGAYEIGWRPE